jgi:hypothetical protein
MAKYDQCLDRQTTCTELSNINNSNRNSSDDDQGDNCTDISRECQTILDSCYNRGTAVVDKPHPTATRLEEEYIPTWTPPETFLDPSPTAITNIHCLPLYHHCIPFYTTCIEQLSPHQHRNPNAILKNEALDFENHAKACYQILLRCKSQITDCTATSSPPLATWIPDTIAKGVEIPPWDPVGLIYDHGRWSAEKGGGTVEGSGDGSGLNNCMQGYHRCLIMVRDCLMVGELLEEGGWWERAEKQRNTCQRELVPLCVRGVEVCRNLLEDM